MNLSKIQSVTRNLLAFVAVAAATIGLILPVAAMRPCACCSGTVQQDTTNPNTTIPSCCSKSCCSKKNSCCEPTQQQIAEQTSSSFCCLGDSSCGNCGGPECRCKAIPVNAIPPAPPLCAPEQTENPSGGIASLSLNLPTLTAASERLVEDIGTPYSNGNLRLHSRLCVWLN